MHNQENIIFLLGPCHRRNLPKCGLTNLDLYQTPLGDLKINKQIT